MEIFTGMLIYDTFSVFVRSTLLLFLLLFVVFTRLTGVPDTEDSPDIYTLVLGAALGMCLMASANHLLMVFMAVEMASVPSYALAGQLKGKRIGSEAALKYAVYGAGAAGVMVYGISLLAGITNSAHIPTIAQELVFKLPVMSASEQMVLAVAGLAIGVGLAFKLSAFPFHFWAPDVFEGATAEVGAFLSVASKAGALALLVRVAIGVSSLAPPGGILPGELTAQRQKKAVAVDVSTDIHFVSGEAADLTKATATVKSRMDGQNAVLGPIRTFTAQVIMLIAVLSCTFGNLAAYGQTNIKRLLAYSTIAHAGYMMMAVSAATAVSSIDPEVARQSVASLGIYIIVYLFMNLGAFYFVAIFRNAMQSEEIADYAGLIRRFPISVVLFVAILVSLIGLPPLAGFIGKFAVFAAVYNAYLAIQTSGISAAYLLVGLLLGGLNTVFSLYYYLRVVKTLTIDPEPDERTPFVFSDVSLQGMYLWIIGVPTVGLMFSWDSLSTAASAAAKSLF